METFAAISARRSIKKFDPDHVMPEAELTQLLEATIQAPTSFNIQNWRFVVITDGEQKQKIRAIGWNQEQFTHCSALVIVCGDRNAYRQETERYWATAPDETRAVLVGMIHQFYDAHPDWRRDENFRSGSLAAQNLMLAAKAMDYDTCPMVGFDFEAAAEIINMPAEHDIIMAVAVGKALEPAREHGGQVPLDEVVCRDRFA